MEDPKMWEARQFVEQTESGLEKLKQSGADPGLIAEVEHHAKAARRNYTIAKRVADAGAAAVEHGGDEGGPTREREPLPATVVWSRAAAGCGERVE